MQKYVLILTEKEGVYIFLKLRVANNQNFIRNFCIISHIDHGKSTLANQILKNSFKPHKQHNQVNVLDAMTLEQERGITIKLNTIQIQHQFQGKMYYLNLIDTPGHVDFNFEVSRSLFACQGALLLVDASKGIQAQTITNLELAQKSNLQIVPAINKIDLERTETDKIKTSINKLLKINSNQISLISAKKNWGITTLMDRIVKEIKPPSGSKDKPLQALIFDAYYDQYQGVTGLIFVENGFIEPKMRVRSVLKKQEYQITSLKVKKPYLSNIKCLQAGEVGFFQANIKKLNEIIIGDTLVKSDDFTSPKLSEIQKVNHSIFAHFFPEQQKHYQDLEKFLIKIQLTDAALFFEKSTSSTLGNGFYCGFLGLLHLDIVQTRLKREYNLTVVVTAPSVSFQLEMNNKEKKLTKNIDKFKHWKEVKRILEPIAKVQILTPVKNLGPIMNLVKEKRGFVVKQEMLNANHLKITTKIPLQEVVINFSDQIRSISNGFASFDYQFDCYQEGKLVKLDVLVNREIIPTFSQIVHQRDSIQRGREMINKLKNLIPKHNFKISLQAAINNKIIAREDIKALQKNVVAKCYGGDITRKRKLWQKQKTGKMKMQKLGKVRIPGEIFFQVLNKNFKKETKPKFYKKK